MKDNKKVDNRTGDIDLKSNLKTVETGLINNVYVFTSNVNLVEFAKQVNKQPNEILKYFFLKGKMLTINSTLNEEEIGELCLEYGYDFEKKKDINVTNFLENIEVVDNSADLVTRPPIITIMGHVDHGKTTLLDYIRKSSVTKTEKGGITQHIGAYQIQYNKNKITFIDTPGHEAFSEMRYRGANLTDIVVLVVSAEDGIKPQTAEAISHIKLAKVPAIVFINKMDKPNANPEKVMAQLSDQGLNPEEWGGNTIVVKGSALSGNGVDTLLDSILILSEMNEYKANPNRLAVGVVLESGVEKGFGVFANLLIQNGTLKRGDLVISGSSYGKVKAMFNENKVAINEALPSMPIKMFGLDTVPNAGNKFLVSKNEADIKEIANIAKNVIHNEELNNNFNQSQTDGDVFHIIIKVDVMGSMQAIKKLLSAIEIEGVKLNLAKCGIGAITESDIQLAKITKSPIIGFNVKPMSNIREMAKSNDIDILFYDIIYKLADDVVEMMKGTLKPVYEEVETGEALVQQIWTHSKIGTIAGCKVVSGEVNRSDSGRVLRDGVVIYATKIASLKHYKDDVAKIKKDMECGIVLDKWGDIKPNDIIQTYKVVESKKK